MGGTEKIYGNGISVDGTYGPVMSLDELYEAITQEPNARSQAEARLVKKKKPKTAGLAPTFYAEADSLETPRWGIIWPDNAALTTAERDHIAALRKNLEPLIAHRLKQMGTDKPYEFYCKPGWDPTDFLWEEPRRLGFYNFNPQVVPYYLMIVASPAQISWEFQQYLDINYGVGRLWFDDAADCSAYVKAVLACEPVPKPDLDPVSWYFPAPNPTAKQALIVGTQHLGDGYTHLTSQYFVPGIRQWLDKQSKLGIGTEVMLGAGSSVDAGAFKKDVLQRLTGKAQAGSAVAASGVVGHGHSWKGISRANPGAVWRSGGACLPGLWDGRA